MSDVSTTVDAIDAAVDRWWERLRGNAPLDRLYYAASEAADFSLLWHTAGVVQAIIRCV